MEMLNGLQTAAVVCTQHGDTGKGKVVDLLAEWADYNVRGTGGPNAGHTLVINSATYIFHQAPCGITYDSEGKVSIMGSGMVIDPETLWDDELAALAKAGMSFNNLKISKWADVILPQHVARDRARYAGLGNGGIGSTGRGIGPCYGDKVLRRGIKIEDLLDVDALEKKLRALLPLYEDVDTLGLEGTIEHLRKYARELAPFIYDTGQIIRDALHKGKKLALEGAQGTGLSIEHGNIKYCTSSDCTINGLASGAGISAADVQLILQIIKFPFQTRVGGGPFPTEFGGRVSEKYCDAGTEHDIFYEAKEYIGMDLNLEKVREMREQRMNIAFADLESKVIKHINNNHDRVIKLVNSEDPFKKGIGVRLAAFEYGATTKRPRRTGWTDLVMAKYAVKINGPILRKPKLVLTKPDCLSDTDGYELCTAYYMPDGRTTEYERGTKFLRNAWPVYEKFGAYGDIRGVKKIADLPPNLLKGIRRTEELTGGEVVLVSNGPGREHLILQ